MKKLTEWLIKPFLQEQGLGSKKKIVGTDDYTFGPSWIPTNLAQRKKMKRLHKKLNRSIREAPRVPRKKGQHRGSKSHSDLYTDENPKGTIKGLKFATVKDAEASVRKIKSSGRSHAHKIQAAVAMEQRAREMGKTSQAAVYRKYINQMKKKTKKKNEDINIPVKIGDTILTGRFKNKKVVVKSIDKDEHGMPTINGKKITTFRVLKKENVNEGINDPGIFKAVFLAGGPGSGKTYVAKGLFGIPDRVNVSQTGMKMINQDKELKFLLKKFGFGTDLDKMPDEVFDDLTGPDGSGLRKFAKELNKQRLKLYVKGRLGVIVDGTGHNFNKIASQKAELEELGYDTFMVFVNTSLDVAQKRNQERDRVLPKNIVSDSWKDVQANLGKFQSLFRGNFLIVDNSKFLDEKASQKKFEMLVKKGIAKFIKKPIKNKNAKSWMRKEKLLRKQGIKEAFAVRGNKIEKFITGKNLKHQGKRYKEIEFEVIKVDNSKELVTLRILAPKKLFGQEVPVRFRTLRRGPFLKTDTGKTETFSFDGTIPSPSRKLVKKMKQKGHTSVPYGSGYKKVQEFINKPKIKKALRRLVDKNLIPANFITNSNKLEKFLSSNPSVMTKLIGLLGEEVNEQKKIKKVIGVYGGRFQPFGPHHKKTYEWLKSRVDDAFITTSNIKQPPRHPMNFKEKVRHMVKMGIPKNRIVQEKSPYVAKNVLSKYDKDTTAVVYIFGAKDAGRLKGGKYFQDYKKNKNNLMGYEESGYVLTAPHQSVKVAGNEVSGTVMRQLLGSPNYEEDREKLFKKAFGYFDKGIYNMMTNKFKKLFESFKLSDSLIKEFILEASGTVLSPTDDGPPTFHKGFSDYKKFSKKWLDNMYADAGWKVINYMLGKNAVNPDYDYTMSYNTVPAVAYGHKQSGDYGSRFGVENPIESYKSYINDVVLKNLGYELIKWMGITPDGKSYTGVEVETPVVPGVGDDNVANTETDKLKLKEINLNKEVKLIIEGGAYGHMNHPFDDKNLTFSDLKQIIINGLGGDLNREDNVTEKLDGQNLMISWVNGKLVTARNKGQLKNYGATAMDTAGVAAKFAGRGDIKKAFVFAMRDLSKAVGKLTDAQKEKVFGNGKRWMNLEIIYPASTNVIDYDKTEIIFHGTLEYNESGRAIGQPKDSARMLAGMIKQVNQNVQKKYNIGKPNFLKVPKVQDFSKKKQGFISRLDKLKREFALKDNDTLAKYHQSFWEEFIFNAAKQYNYNIPNNILVDLTKRWAFFDKSYSVQDMRKEIDNKDFLDWALSFDKTDHKKYVKDNMKPFEILFLDVGTQILKNMSGFLAASPKSAVQKIRKDVVKAINTVSKSKDVKKINTLKAQIEKLEAIGGLSSIVPSEGIVFKYKGNTYKFTGAFAPVNQIVGLLNF